MSELRDKLAAEVAPTGWELLEPHYRRDGLIVVDGSLDLVEVAVAVAEDRLSDVEGWVAAGQLTRPSAEQADAWAADDTARFRFVIVQPYVLAQVIRSG